MATDPVCGMAVDEKRAAGKTVHAGKTYYFCSIGCLGKFKANPTAYLDAAQAVPLKTQLLKHSLRKENTVDHEHREHQAPRESFWRSRTGWVLIGFLAIAGFFLVTEHRAHLFGWLPFILLALCPLMHIFGHGGHNHSRNKDDKS